MTKSPLPPPEESPDEAPDEAPDATPDGPRETPEQPGSSRSAAEDSHLAPLPPGQLYRFAWTFYLILAAIAVLWIGWRDGGVTLRVFVDPGSWWLDVGLGAAAGLLLVGVWEVARQTLAPARRLTEALAALIGPLSKGDVIGLALLSGFSEELLFRGAVQGSLGAVAATVLFALLHSGPGRSYRLWTLFALVAGALFAGLVVWRGSLLAAIVAHVVVNAINLGRLAGGVETAAQPVSSR